MPVLSFDAYHTYSGNSFFFFCTSVSYISDVLYQHLVGPTLYQTSCTRLQATILATTTAVPYKQWVERQQHHHIITQLYWSCGNSIALKWQWPHQQLSAGGDSNSFCNQQRWHQHQNSAVKGHRNKSSGGIGPSDSNNSNTVSSDSSWNSMLKFHITIHWQWQKQEQYSVGKS